MARGRRYGILAVIVMIVVALAAWTGFSILRAISFNSAMREVRDELSRRRFGIAADRLARLSAQFPGEGEVWRLLGECQLARGRRAEAVDAWNRVQPDSPSYIAATENLATEWINTGHYSLAEARLGKVLSDPEASKSHSLERALGRLYRFEGRLDDLRDQLQRAWARSPDRVEGLRELWLLDNSPQPVEAWLGALRKADQNDDRVWLGYANHAILTGSFEVARQWLDRCETKRAEDEAVWHARLELARATGDAAALLLAARHLSPELFRPIAVQSLRAWLAGRSADRDLERRELAELIRRDVGNTVAIERLTELCVRAGDQAEVDRLRKRKAVLDEAKDQFRKALLGSAAATMIARSGELSQLAGQLGRSFDAMAWANLQKREWTPETVAFVWRPVAEKQASENRVFEQLKDLASLLKQPSDRPLVGDHQQERFRASQNLIEPRFVDDAEASGLRFVFDNGQTTRRYLPETMSGGVGLLDYDGDGWLDVYCVQGGAIMEGAEASPRGKGGAGDRLFRNKGHGQFEDVSERSGIAAIATGNGYGLGVAVGDYDNDGHPDLLVTRLTSYALYRNLGNGRFENATAGAGLEGRRDYPSSAAFADLDNDGDLDLYVCHYMVWDPDHPSLCENDKGDSFYCDPSKVEPAPDHCFRNDKGRFTDVTLEAGISDNAGRGLGVLAADLDDDQQVDLYVANDGTANYFFRNKGGFRFEEIALEAGVAGSATGGYQAGMGLACGDLDGDERPDLLVTNFYGEGITLYQNLGHGLFTDRSSYSGIGIASRYLLGFGIGMADTTNGGKLDVIVTNGHVNDNRPYYPYAMPSRIYQNLGDGRVQDFSSRAGPPWSVARLGRGLAVGDLDNDGRLDAVIVSQNEPLAYFHNQAQGAGHSLTIELEGTKSNRDGVGCRVLVQSGGQRQVSQRMGGRKLSIGTRTKAPLRTRPARGGRARGSSVVIRADRPLERPSFRSDLSPAGSRFKSASQNDSDQSTSWQPIGLAGPEA